MADSKQPPPGEEQGSTGPPQQPASTGPPQQPASTGPPQQPGQPAPPMSYAYNAQGQTVQGYAMPNQPGYTPGPQYGPGAGQPATNGQPVPYGVPPPSYIQPGQQVIQPGVYGQPGVPGQPQPVQWMQRPESVPGCPPGLEYLTQIDQLLVHQQVEIFEMMTNWETRNRYQIKNSVGQQVYFAQEESDTCHRQCCGPSRGFIMHITDNLGQEVIRVNREFKCCAGFNCCAGANCCSMEIEIEAPVGQVVGYVKQRQSCLAPKYSINDAQDQSVLMIEGPTCICQGPCCTNDQEFIVYSCDMAHEVGKISKQWSGFVKEYFTQADNFGISFPMDLDVKLKAVMIGAVFLIDFMFFENKNNNHN